MTDVVGLVLPFFGLIFLGFFVARITRQPLDALGWMNTFIIYVALPALFFQLLAKTPIEQLTEWSFIFGSVFSTYMIFSIMFVASVLFVARRHRGIDHQGLAAAYGNIGYMGPGLALLAFGEEAAVPVALIFCFENIMHFAIAPMMMALSGDDKQPPLQLALERRSARSCCIRSSLRPPSACAPPISSSGRRCRSSASRLSVARRRTLRAVCHGRDAGAAAAEAHSGRACADRAAEAHPASRCFAMWC